MAEASEPPRLAIPASAALDRQQNFWLLRIVRFQEQEELPFHEPRYGHGLLSEIPADQLDSSTTTLRGSTLHVPFSTIAACVNDTISRGG